MALNADLQVLTQPGATGNQTYSLAANFDPKAVILWTTPNTVDGTVVHASFGVGYGTYRGAVVQQRYASFRALDAATVMDLARGQGSDALLMLMTSSAGASSRDLEIDLVSMQTGATSDVVLNWVNLHTTASVRVFMLVLGGSDITDALAGDFTIANSTPQDVTVAAGFGKPDLLFLAGAGAAATDAAADPTFFFGFGKQGEAGRGFGYTELDGNTASITGTRQSSAHIMQRIYIDPGGIPADAALGALDTVVTNWPVDGFRLIYNFAPGGGAAPSNFLALRTTAQITTGAGVAPIAGTPPVVQDLAAGFTPKLGFNFGWNLAASTGHQVADASQVGFGIGAFDGTTEGWAGFTVDDGLGTENANSQQVITKSMHYYNASSVLLEEADGLFSGNNYQLSWNDIDTVARQYQWLALGDAVVVSVTHPRPPTIVRQAVQRAASW